MVAPCPFVSKTMAQATYFVGLFTVDSWQEFLAHGGNIMGFQENKASSVHRLRHGDRLLAYLTRVSAFVGVLEVVGEPFYDATPLWSDGEFPVRIAVKVRDSVPIERAVPMAAVLPKLSFARAKPRLPAYWSIHVRSSPRRWLRADAKTVEKEIIKRSRKSSGDSNDGQTNGFTASKQARVAVRRRLIDVCGQGRMPRGRNRVLRVSQRTAAIRNSARPSVLRSWDSVLSFNKVTGYSVNVPIAETCVPTAVCANTCYFAIGAPAWKHALRHQLRIYDAICADPIGFARRVALEYDKRGLTFIRWNGGGDLFAESVDTINALSEIRPDIVIWVVTRSVEWAPKINDSPNVYVQFSLDRHSLSRRREVLAQRPLSRNLFFSYQCDEGEQPAPSKINEISVLFFHKYQPTSSLRTLPAEIICPLNVRENLRGVCETCRRCFNGDAVSHGKKIGKSATGCSA